MMFMPFSNIYLHRSKHASVCCTGTYFTLWQSWIEFRYYSALGKQFISRAYRKKSACNSQTPKSLLLLNITFMPMQM